MNRLHLHRSIIYASRLSFSRAGGPGGQNVNKVNTKVELRLALANLEGLSENELSQVRRVLTNRITGSDELILSSTEERSQFMNRELVFAKAEALIISAARLPKKRKPSAPTRASKERRLRKKKLQGLQKASRHFRDMDD